MAQKFTVPITVKQLASAGSDAVTVYVDADTYARLKIEAGGRLTWGSGSATGDVNLYRDSADVLKTDDTFKVPALFVDSIEVDTTGATTNQVLKFDGTKFAPGTASTVGSIDDLSDVDTTTTAPTTNQYLKWNGTNWVPSTVSAGGIIISDTAPSSPTSGQIWFESDTAQTFVYYDSSWIEIGASSITASVQGTAPASPVSGQIWLNSSTGIAYIYYESSWIDIGAASLINTINAKGDIYVGTADNTVAALTVGSTDQVLTVDSSTATGLKWASIPTINSLDDVGGVVITSPLEYESLVYNGTNWVNQYASTATYVRNAEATTLTTGTVVYLFGATGDHATVKRADNDSDTTSSKTVGLVASPIAASENGPVVTRGYVDGIDLSVGYASGDVLWLGEDGAFTKTKPTAPEHLVFIGVVVRATNNGIIYVATQNGYELDELHDVSLPSPTSGDFLKYNGSVWVSDAIDLGTDTTGNYVQSLVAGTGVTLTNNSGESATPTVAVDTAVIQARVTNVTDTEIGYLDGVTSAIQTQIDSKLATSTASTTYAPLASPTFTGTPTLPTGTIATTQTAGNNTTAVATTAFVTTAVSGATVVVSSATAPASPTAGLVWFNTSTGASYIYYNSAWVELGGGSMSPYQATSSTRPSSPWTGQHVYETDTSLEYVYGGSAWQQVSGGTAVGNSGLVYVKSQTVGTGVSSVTVSDAFSTTYDNYQIQLSGGVGSGDANLRLTLGATATGYYAGGLYVGYTASTVTGVNTNNGAFIDIGYGSTNALSGRGEIESPFLAKRTVFRTNPVSSSTGYPFGIFGGFLNDATSYTAFTITASSGTMTGGTITVYGYRK